MHFDRTGDTLKGMQIARKFILEDKVDFMLGPTSSAVALALADFVEQQKKILVLTQSDPRRTQGGTHEL